MKLRELILLIMLPLAGIKAFPQAVPHPVSNYGIYEFLDELANAQIIEINSAIKPFSRLFIAEKLKEAKKQADKLNPRQLAELGFYLRDFSKELDEYESERVSRNSPPLGGLGGQGVSESESESESEKERGRDGERARVGEGESESEKRIPGAPPLGGQGVARGRLDLFYYSDSLFSITINPILGAELFRNPAGTATYWRNGAEVRAYAGSWGFYASLRDNHEKPLLGKAEYLTRREGGHLKGSTDWSEMRGGLTWSWDWGSAGLLKDEFTWGTNYNGANIFGGHTPTFIQLRLSITPVKWLSMNYFHGWLNSMVVDSSESYWVNNSYGADYREVYHKKFISANMFTLTPLKNLKVSAGNSIIYDNPTINPAFLVPLFFYKSVDHSVSSGIDNMNSQMFLDVSSRQIRNLHLYATLFVDELSVDRFTMKDEWNFFSWKGGFRLSNFPVENLSFTSEFTYTYPLTFQHYVPTLTFESNNFNLGHYLKDNSREWYFSFAYKPLSTLNINLWFTDAVRGPDFTELGGSRLGNPPLASTEWYNTSFGLNVSYQVINDLYVWLSAAKSKIGGDVRWSPGYFYGDKFTLNGGVTVGF